MKKLHICLIALAFCLFMAGSALAEDCFSARGSALVNGMWARYGSSTSYAKFMIFVTNVSSSNVDCKVTVRDYDGSDVTSHSFIWTGDTSTQGWSTLATGTGEFTVPAQATHVYEFDATGMPEYHVCHALIEWDSDDPAIRKALIANVRYLQKAGTEVVVTNIPVNGGLLF